MRKSPNAWSCEPLRIHGRQRESLCCDRERRDTHPPGALTASETSSGTLTASEKQKTLERLLQVTESSGETVDFL